ncbi:MAG: urease cluster protein [Streptococcus thermophilus]
MIKTNNYTTNLQLVSQEYPDEKTSLQTKTKKLLEYFSPKDIWKIKGLIVACLVACFLYVTYLTHFSFAFPAIVVLISTIELGCRLLGGKAKGMRIESAILMVTSLLQGLQISLWGLHDNWGSAWILCLHASILLYLMARTGQSSQDRLGIMVWLDLIYTSCIFPLKYFFIGAWTLLYKTAPKQELSEEEKHAVQNHKWMILISIMIALILMVFAASQVLPAFGQLWQQFFHTLATLLDFTITFKDNGLLFSRLITSIPLAQDFLLNLLQPIWQKKSHLVKNDLKAVLKQPVSFQK